MPEFLLFIIDCLHTTLARKIKMKICGNKKTKIDLLAFQCYQMLQGVYEKEYSEIMDLFYAIYISELTSLEGNHVHNMKPEQFFILDLPISSPVEGKVTLSHCFDLFTAPELLDGDNSWKNETSGVYEAVRKTISFFSLPKILVITLKRFDPNGLYKLNTLVQFPLEGLDLSSYVRGYFPNKYVYDLYGVCNHHGSALGGHYTSFVRNSKNEWILFNDSIYQVIVDPATIVSSEAYCLFYRIRGFVIVIPMLSNMVPVTNSNTIIFVQDIGA